RARAVVRGGGRGGGLLAAHGQVPHEGGAGGAGARGRPSGGASVSDVRETTSGCPGSDLLLLLRHELLEELDEPGEAARLRAHLDGCPSCAARAETLDEALAPPADPSPPGEVFQALEARIAADAVAAA